MTEQVQAEGPPYTLNRQSKDVDGNGFLYSEELRGLASELGFEGSDSEWSQEYVMICSEVGCNPAQGMDFRGFSQFVDDE
ncbi:ANKRD50, partial [Symbiodinium sp. CCMP2456]